MFSSHETNFSATDPSLQVHSLTSQPPRRDDGVGKEQDGEEKFKTVSGKNWTCFGPERFEKKEITFPGTKPNGAAVLGSVHCRVLDH